MDKSRASTRCITTILLLAAVSAHALQGHALQLNAGVYNTGSLMLVNIQNGNKQTLESANTCGPIFSPDGKRIAYCAKNSIYVVNNDGTGKFEVKNSGIATNGKVALSWSNVGGTDYIYYHNAQSPALKRIKLDGSGQQTVYSSPNNLMLARVCRDGSRAAWTCPNPLSVKGVQLIPRTGGEICFTHDDCRWCQGSVSPGGKYVTRNRGSHKEFFIYDWTKPNTLYRSIPTMKGNACNQHRFSSSSDDYVVYSDESQSSAGGAYICNIQTRAQVQSPVRGAILDFWLGALPDPGGSTTKPSLALSADKAEFAAKTGAAASTPASVTITASNDVANTTLPVVTISGAPAWLSVTVDAANRNSQKIANTPVMAQLTQEKTYTATITVNASGAQPSSLSYTATCIVSSGDPVFSSVTVTPAQETIGVGSSPVQFSAVAKDQFGAALSPQPTFSWSATGGTIENGLYTPGNEAGSFQVKASATVGGSTHEGTATVTLQEALYTLIAPQSGTFVIGETIRFEFRARSDVNTAVIELVFDDDGSLCMLNTDGALQRTDPDFGVFEWVVPDYVLSNAAPPQMIPLDGKICNVVIRGYNGEGSVTFGTTLQFSSSASTLARSGGVASMGPVVRQSGHGLEIAVPGSNAFKAELFDTRGAIVRRVFGTGGETVRLDTDGQAYGTYALVVSGGRQGDLTRTVRQITF